MQIGVMLTEKEIMRVVVNMIKTLNHLNVHTKIGDTEEIIATLTQMAGFTKNTFLKTGGGLWKK